MKIKKHNLLAVVIALMCINSFAIGQILQPAKWSNTTTPTEAKVGDIIELIFTANLDDTWYIYSHDQDPKLGPLPAVFKFEKNSSYKLVGDMTAVGVKEKYDDIWEGNVRVLEHKAEFRQKIKILKPQLTITVNLEYQTCTTVDGKCIPGDEDFEFNNIKVVK